MHYIQLKSGLIIRHNEILTEEYKTHIIENGELYKGEIYVSSSGGSRTLAYTKVKTFMFKFGDIVARWIE